MALEPSYVQSISTCIEVLNHMNTVTPITFPTAKNRQLSFRALLVLSPLLFLLLSFLRLELGDEIGLKLIFVDV